MSTGLTDIGSLSLPGPGPLGQDAAVAGDQVEEAGVIEDGRGGVAHLEEEAEEPGVAGFRPHPVGQLRRIPEGSEGPVHDADDLADQDLPGRPAQAVAALASSLARHHPGVLEGDQDPFQELLGDGLLLDSKKAF